GTDAGQDRIYVWKLTLGGTPPLTPAMIPFVKTPPGDGPRHFAFHSNGVWMYSIQEEGSTIIFWRFNPATGALVNEQQVHRVPPGFPGTNFTSEIRVSADGDFVYGANRLNDTIAVFRSVTMESLLRSAASQRSGIIQEYSLSIPPDGSWRLGISLPTTLPLS